MELLELELKLDEIKNTNTNTTPKEATVTGKILLVLTGGLAVGLTAVCVPFVSPALRRFCLPYIPATDSQVRNVMEALRGRRGSLLDLGSGDGRLVTEAASRGFTAHGVELNPWLVAYSKVDSYRRNLHHRARFFRDDLWKYDVKEYDNVVIFGVEEMMNELEKKLQRECKEGCRVVACRFPLPGAVPLRTVGHGVDTVWIYSINRGGGDPP